MDVLDEEVFAVIMAIVVVASVVGIAQLIRSEVVEPFTAIGLLNSECRIGDYPKEVFEGEELRLCLYLYNHLGRPQLMMVKYKLGDKNVIPTNMTPSPEAPLKTFKFLLNHGANTTLPVRVPIPLNTELVGKEVALIFELWVYDKDLGEWVYSGRWVHLYVKMREAPIPWTKS